MKIERLSQDKIRIFLTFDDLSERGIQREDLWREMSKLQELFAEMMDQAYTELGFDATGPLAVEVFAMPAQGMVVIVTRTRWDNSSSSQSLHGDEEELDDVYEMEVTLEESDTIVFAFRDFEHFIEAAHTVNGQFSVSGSLYQYNGQWIYHVEPNQLETARLQALIAILAEFGEATSVTTAVLEEYGKCIIAEDAIAVTCQHFKPRNT
ncbi:genetic competence negative regulator [Paenibacillus sp. 481]|uniref:genetic competence negative regulator n=1 Tax=Paenibacillus sp. 481 TaxID=2835869 RepID=UPI001E4003FE|nr:genetic competence negative regulator [Paenibacillus sp. 481]UHA72939.1 genetic competence negative regulator [Paenibacillus sp. 481]